VAFRSEQLATDHGDLAVDLDGEADAVLVVGPQSGPDRPPGEQRRETVLAGVNVRADQQIEPRLAALRAGVQAQEPVREAQVEFGRFMATGGAGCPSGKPV